MKLWEDHLFVILLRIIGAFHIEFEESVEEYLACLYIELFLCVAACHLDVSLENLGVSHL